MKRQDTKIMQDFNIRPEFNRVVRAGHSDIVLITKKNREKFIIVVVCGYTRDCRVKEKEAEKLLKYQNIALEIFGL